MTAHPIFRSTSGRFVSSAPIWRVGGGGAFAGGFVSIHAGEIPIGKVVEQLSGYLQDFASIIELYRFWSELPTQPESLVPILDGVHKRHSDRILDDMSASGCKTVYDAYSAGTRYATHQMRSYRTAFDLLERINSSFQKLFPFN